MDIVRTYREGGELRAETSSGRLVVWDPELSRWSETEADRLAGESPSQPTQDPGRSPWAAAPPGALTALAQPADDRHDGFPPLGPIDEAWNRKFPPFSGRRLAFGLVMLPLMSLLFSLWRAVESGDGFSLRQFLFTVVAGSMVLTATFAMNWVRDPDAKPSAPTGLPDIDALPEGWSVQRSPSMTPFKEIALSAALLFIGGMGMMAFIDTRLLSPVVLAGSLVSSGALAAMIYWRAWMLLAAVFAALAGAIPAFFLTLWGAFMGGSDSLAVNWALSSGVILLFVLPIAWGTKRRAEVLQGRMRFPTWVMAGLTCVTMLMTGAITATTPEQEQPADVEAEVAWGADTRSRPADSPQVAAQRLFSAWSTSDRKSADAYGAPDVVARLFSSPFSGQRLLGCGHLPGDAATQCAIDMGAQMLLLKPTRHGDGFKVTEVREVPAETELVGLGRQPKS